MVESMTLFFLLFTIGGLVVVVLFLFNAYQNVQKKLLQLTRQNQYLKNRDLVQSEEILKNAHNRAVIIIDEANKKASEIVKQASAFDQSSKTMLREKMTEAAQLHSEELKKASADLLALYKDALKNIQQTDTDHAATIANDIKNQATKEISNFSRILAKETVESEKIIEEKLNEEYHKLEAQLNAYKESRLKEIDDDILQIIQTVTEAVLQKQLSVSDQQQLVYEALKEAKNQVQRN